jgi:hypothetical protein
VTAGERLDERTDVLTPLMERGQRDSDAGDAVVEVAAKPPGLQALGEILLDRGNQSKVDCGFSAIAQPTHLARLQDAEQLDLAVDRQA